MVNISGGYTPNYPDYAGLEEDVRRMTSGVDVKTRHEILHELADLNDEGIAIVLSTHDLNGLAAHLPRYRRSLAAYAEALAASA